MSYLLYYLTATCDKRSVRWTHEDGEWKLGFFINEKKRIENVAKSHLYWSFPDRKGTPMYSTAAKDGTLRFEKFLIPFCPKPETRFRESGRIVHPLRDLFPLIASFLDIKNLCKFKSLCKPLHTVGQHKNVWAHVINNEFGLHEKPEANDEMRAFYKRVYLIILKRKAVKTVFCALERQIEVPLEFDYDMLIKHTKVEKVPMGITSMFLKVFDSRGNIINRIMQNGRRRGISSVNLITNEIINREILNRAAAKRPDLHREKISELDSLSCFTISVPFEGSLWTEEPLTIQLSDLNTGIIKPAEKMDEPQNKIPKQQ